MRDLVSFDSSGKIFFKSTSSEKIYQISGHKILFSDFCMRFQAWLSSDERNYWTNRRIAKEVSYEKGKAGGDGQLYLGNISFDSNGLNGLAPLIVKDGRLISKILK